LGAHNSSAAQASPVMWYIFGQPSSPATRLHARRLAGHRPSTPHRGQSGAIVQNANFTLDVSGVKSIGGIPLLFPIRTICRKHQRTPSFSLAKKYWGVLGSSLPLNSAPHFSFLAHNFRGVGVTVDGQRIGVGGHRTRPATEFGPDRSWASVRKMGSKFGVMTSTLPPPSPRGSSSAQIRIALVELGRQANCQLVRPATRGAAARQKTITMARYALRYQ
jgi:hypothetical protein